MQLTKVYLNKFIKNGQAELNDNEKNYFGFLRIRFNKNFICLIVSKPQLILTKKQPD